MNSTKTKQKLRRHAIKILRKLVTTHGIYASMDKGWSGSFHSWFGRDSAITAALIFDTEALTGNYLLSGKAYRSLKILKHWQGKKNNLQTGEEIGKISHEVRKKTSRNLQTRLRLRLYRGLWYSDPHDHLLKNWDSVDSTPLWIISVARLHEQAESEYSSDLLEHLKSALEWCLQNLDRFDGWAGFVSAEQQVGHPTIRLRNQGWKDHYDTYHQDNGTFMTYPVKDVFVNGCFWAALRYGADIFALQNPSFAEVLREQAKDLKLRFNRIDSGFLFIDKPTSLHYFADALDGNNRPSHTVTSDVGLCLWAYHGGDCIIDKRYLNDVVQRLMLPDMLNPHAGLRTYSSRLKMIGPIDGYHRGPETYWPFVSGLVMDGFDHFGFVKEACIVGSSMLEGVSRFNTNIEQFLGNPDGTYNCWKHPTEQQQSSSEQAWTAAAVYFATAYLGHEEPTYAE